MPIKLIGHLGHRIEPEDEGYIIEGETFGTLGGAINRARKLAAEKLAREENELQGKIIREEDREYMRSERTMRAVIFTGAIVLAWMLAGCQVNERPRIVAMPPEVAGPLSPIAFLVILAGACFATAAVAYCLGRTREDRRKKKELKNRCYPSAIQRN